jgi:Lipocalin-like domain
MEDQMTTKTIGQRLCGTFTAITLSTLLSVLGLVPLTGDAVAQSAKDLVGTWTLVSVVNTRPDGTKFDPNDGKAGGMLFFASTGQFSWQTIRSDIPKLASNNRSQGTADEFKAVAQGVLSYFGTYSLDDSGKTLTQHVKGSSFPNYNGTDRKWSIALSGDELTLASQVAASGGTNELKWKRVK